MKNLIWILCLASFVSMAQNKPATKSNTKTKGSKELVKEPVVQPDRKASYVGGSNAMDKFILDNLKTPAKLKTDTAIKTTTVFLKFLIDKNGKVTNATVMKGIKNCKECSDEAIRVVNLMPNWIPAVENNEVKETWFNLPINFNKN
jgi:protein TonB